MESQSSVMEIGMVGLDMEVEAEVVVQDIVSVDVEGVMVEICSGNQNITTGMVDQEPCLLKASVIPLAFLLSLQYRFYPHKTVKWCCHIYFLIILLFLWFAFCLFAILLFSFFILLLQQKINF